jgi:hypothetical protein
MYVTKRTLWALHSFKFMNLAKLRQIISNDTAIDKLRVEKYDSPVLKWSIIHPAQSRSCSMKDHRCTQDGRIASFIY